MAVVIAICAQKHLKKGVKLMKFRDIPKFPRTNYHVNVDWYFLQDHMEQDHCGVVLDTNPEYQRGHVWTDAQQIAYIEYRLRGGEAGTNILTNFPGWSDDWRGPYELMDGKQRINAVLRFMAGEIPAFGGFWEDYEDRIRTARRLYFDWYVYDLQSRDDILNLYVNLNSGGTPHSDEEIDRVRAMIKNPSKEV